VPKNHASTSDQHLGLLDNRKIILVDLNLGSVQAEVLPEKYNAYIGGRLLGLVLYRDFQNEPLVFATSPVNSKAYARHLNGRVILVGKSPLTGSVYSSNSGGPLGVWMGENGFAAIIVMGSAKENTYLDLESLKLTLQPPATKRLHYLQAARCGCDYSILKDNAQKNFPEGMFGRGGFGKALAEKNIIAINYGEVSQHKRQQPDKIKNYLREKHPGNTRPFQDNFYSFGVSKILVKNNWRELSVKDDMFTSMLEQIEASSSDENPVTDLEYSRYGSTGTVLLSKKTNRRVKGPQNQTAEILGPNLGISQLEDIYAISYACDEVGLDTISFGAVIACAMDMFEAGKLSTADTEGLQLNFGHPDIVMTCLEKVCNKEDQSEFTNALRKGVKHFAAHYNAEEYAMHTRGISFTAYNTVNNPFLALLFATSMRGPDHFRGGGIMKMQGKDIADAVIRNERNGIACDILGLDRFSSIGWDDDQLIECAKSNGLELASDTLDKLALQVLVLERMLYFEALDDYCEDTLPDRILNQLSNVSISEYKASMPASFSSFELDEYQTLLDLFKANISLYHHYLGLNDYGIPIAETIAKLELLDSDAAKVWCNTIDEKFGINTVIK